MPYARNRQSFEVIAAKRRARMDELHAQLVYVDGIPIHPDPPQGHGSSSAYNSAGCRCEVCRAGAHEEYVRTQERHKKLRIKPRRKGETVDLDSVFSFGGPATTMESED